MEESLEEETFPDIGSMSDQELKELIDKPTAEEQEVPYRRRILHGQIDILRVEPVGRLREKRPEGGILIMGDDAQPLSEILAGRIEPPTTPPT
jgi:RsiG-like